ncbi:MAG: hypothetical protein IPG23_04565 [Burkholderiales bacterium]|nr:hypothetical protein [Burkholderiales bacterium]
MNRHTLTALILVLAIGFYALGMETGAASAIAVGCALELWFWARALRRA